MAADDLLVRLDRVGVHQSVAAQYCAESAAEIRRLRTGIAYAIDRLERADGPAMVYQATVDLKRVIEAEAVRPAQAVKYHCDKRCLHRDDPTGIKCPCEAAEAVQG